MSAVLKPAEDILRPMRETDISAILHIENRAYHFPWSEGIFKDCLNAGYCCWILERDEQLLAYCVMTVAVGESHILNLCVDPEMQSQGIGRKLLLHMLSVAQEHHANMTFLEVRPTNIAAISLYMSVGFDEIGMRRNYYPARLGREDALILARTVVTDDEHMPY